MRLALCLLSLVAAPACLGPVTDHTGAGGGMASPKASDTSAPESSDTSADSGSPIPGLLGQRCAECHAADGGHYAPFAGSHPTYFNPSKLCPGERVGDCIARAVEVQDHEGSRCRTYVTPFHREGWECLTSAEIAAIVGWVDAGMPE